MVYISVLSFGLLSFLAGLGKVSFLQSQRKTMPKNAQTTTQLHSSNHELPDVKAGFRKGRGARDQISNICWIIEKAREFQKNIYFCFIDYAKAFDCVDHNKMWKILRDRHPGPPDLPSEVKKQQLELDMEQQTGSK